MDQNLGKTTTPQARVANFENASDIFERVQKNVKTRNDKPEFPFGLKELDAVTHGIKRGKLTMIAARTSEGKTAFSAQLAMSLADSGKRVAFISLEDDREQVIENMACNLMRINNFDLQRGKHECLNNPTIKNFFDNIPILVLDDYGYRFEEVKSVVETLDPKPDIVFIDYIQLAEKEKGLSRYESILEFARSCKVFSNHTNIGIVLNAQINRAGAREGRPSIHHISDCDKLEQYADMILLIHYPFVHGLPSFNYNKQTGEGFEFAPRQWIEVEVAKNKSGMRGVIVPLKFTGQHYLFEDWVVIK